MTTATERRLSSLGRLLHPMCDPCAALWMRWLDYTLPPEPIRLIQIGRPTVREIADHQEARFRQWRDEILWHQALIRAQCPVLHHVCSAGCEPDL